MQFKNQGLGVLLHEQSRFIDGSSVNPIEEASLILNDTSEGLVTQEDLVSSDRNDLKESSIKCFQRDASYHDESSLCDDSSVFDSSWLSSYNSSDDESTSDNIWDFRRFSYKVQGNSEVKLSNSTSFCSLTKEEKVEKSSYDHLLSRNISEAFGFEDFGIDEPLFWPLERKFDWNSEEKWDVICISPTKNGGMVVAKYDGSCASKPVILSLNNSKKDGNADNIIARRNGGTAMNSRLNISTHDLKKNKKKNTSMRYTNSKCSVFNVSWDFDNMGIFQLELLDNKISEAVDCNEFDVSSPLFWPSEIDWNPEEKWDLLCISPCKNAGKNIGTWILNSPVNDLKESICPSFNRPSMHVSSEHDSTSDHISGFDNMGFLPPDLFDEIMSEDVDFEDIDVDGPLFWPSERKVDWNPEEKWDFLCISPSKSGGKKIGSWTPHVKDLKELNSSLFFNRSSMSFSLEYESTTDQILDFDSMDFLPSDLFDENMSEAIECEDIDVNEPLFWPLGRRLDWNPEEKWDLICISPSKNEAKNAAGTEYVGFSATTSSIKVKALKRKQEDLKDGCKRKKARTVGEYGVFLEEDFVSNNQISVGFDEFEKHEGMRVDFDEDVDVNGALFWPLEERKFDWNPEEKWDVICISPCKNEGKIGNESTDGLCVPNKSIKLSSLKRKNEDLNDGFKRKKNKSIEDLEEAFLSNDEMLIEKIVDLNEFNGHEGVKDAFDGRLFFLDEMQYENF